MDLRTLELKIARGENLPVLPQAVKAAFKLADDPTTSTREIAKLIEYDPALTAKVLRVVNSPAYAAGHISSIGRALTVLGGTRIRSLLLSVAFQNMASDRPQSRRFDQAGFWRHSFAVATAARVFGRFKAPDLAEELYCVGILHDIGLVVMDKFCPSELDAAIKRAQIEGVPLVEVERKFLPFTHADLGGLLAAKWGLGATIQTAIEGHHDPKALEMPRSAAALIQIADALAHEAGFTNQLPKVAYNVGPDVMEALDFPQEQFSVFRDVIAAEVEKAEGAFLALGAQSRSPQLGRAAQPEIPHQHG